MKAVFSKEAAKQIKKLPIPVRQRVFNAIDTALADPLSGKPLKGELAGYRRLRVGEYRVLYKYNKAGDEVIVLTVAPRGDVYK